MGQFNGIQVIILKYGATPPGVHTVFLRYDAEREEMCRDIALHVPTVSVRLGGHSLLVHCNGTVRAMTAPLGYDAPCAA